MKRTNSNSPVTSGRYRSLGVDYQRLMTAEGDLFLTKFGLPYLEALLPANWYNDNYFINYGHRLEGTSSVYRVQSRYGNSTQQPTAPPVDLVVKHCRVGQEPQIEMDLPLSLRSLIHPDDLENVRWNGPFEEFGKVMELRSGEFGPPEISFAMQEPLAIFVPAAPINPEWYDRSADAFRISTHIMNTDGTASMDGKDPLVLDISKQYYLIYSWLEGVDARELAREDLLNQDDLEHLTIQAFHKLHQKGFFVLDLKPAHLIILSQDDYGPVKRHEEFHYGLVDYELLIRSPEYEKHHRLSRRRQYWHDISKRYQPEMARPLPEGLHSVNILGVPYIFGSLPNGGKLWVLGYNPALFEYFQPSRWRNAPRIRLSGITDKFHTITPGNIHLVYRRSRVGILPPSDPLEAPPSKIFEHGYNSPFEEVWFAETLRRAGLRTVYPRAIYRTGQQSELTAFLLDTSRYHAMREVMTPEHPPEPVLSRFHEYYTIWGCWRGIDPEKDYLPGAHYGLTTIEQVLNDKIITEEESQVIMNSTVARLKRINLDELFIGKYDFLLSFNTDRQTLKRDSTGHYEITICIDAYCAYFYRLIDAGQYRQIVEATRDDLRKAGVEMLNLAGDHILLSANPDGVIVQEDGGFMRTLCNFELMRKL